MSKKDRSVFYVLLNTDRKTNVPITFITADSSLGLGKDNAKRAATPEEVEAALLAANIPAAAIDRRARLDKPGRAWRDDVGVWETRAAARRAARDTFGDVHREWKVVVIQVGKVGREFKKPTGWRVGPVEDGVVDEGACRFRTRKTAREFGARVYKKGEYKVNPHFGPIEHFDA